MFRQALLSVVVGGFFLAIGGSTASAQEIDYNNWTRHNHGAPPAVDQSGIPCPTGGCQQAIDQMKKQLKHQQAQQDKDQQARQDQQDKEQQAEDERGWDGVGQDPDKIPFSKDTPDPDDADEVYPSNGPALIRK
jgi:hypothetical protein